MLIVMLRVEMPMMLEMMLIRLDYAAAAAGC